MVMRESFAKRSEMNSFSLCLLLPKEAENPHTLEMVARKKRTYPTFKVNILSTFKVVYPAKSLESTHVCVCVDGRAKS